MAIASSPDQETCATSRMLVLHSSNRISTAGCVAVQRHLAYIAVRPPARHSQLSVITKRPASGEHAAHHASIERCQRVNDVYSLHVANLTGNNRSLYNVYTIHWQSVDIRRVAVVDGDTVAHTCFLHS